MSAMLETYDMAMLDYPTDHDIQMHPSSSDQWFPDESKMEEDGPVFKPENFSDTKNEEDILPMTADNYVEENAITDIEVDMELFHDHDNDEYEMQDDELYSGSREETLDVEVHDASLAHTPSMTTFATVQDDTPHFIGSIEHEGPHTHSSPSQNLTTTLPEPFQPSDTTIEGETNASTEEAISVAEEPASLYESHEISVTQAASSHFPETVAEHAVDEEHAQHLDMDHHSVMGPQEFNGTTETTSNPAEYEEEVAPEYPVREPATDHNAQQLVVESEESPLHILVAQDREHHDQTDVAPHSPSANTSGDPHEISEGVYIDPPPPVILSLVSEDQFDYSLFNTSEESKPSSEPDGVNERVFLRHLPTLYYEPLSSVFDALREDTFIQAHLGTSESELVLEAVDLELTLSEDNIYSREVTLHDLNVLHDVSGISGLLRMRLYSSVPRFITRYQYLQEHVSRLTLDEPAADTAPVAHEEEGPAETQQDNEESKGSQSSDAGTLIHANNSNNSHVDNHHVETRNLAGEQASINDLEEEQASTNDLEEEHNYKEEAGETEAVLLHGESEEDSEENSLHPLPAELSEEDSGEFLERDFAHETSENQASTHGESVISDHASTGNDGNTVLDDEGNVISLESLEEYPDDGERFEVAEEEDVPDKMPSPYENTHEADNVQEVPEDVQAESEEIVEHELEKQEQVHSEDQSNDAVPKSLENIMESGVFPTDNLRQELSTSVSHLHTEDAEDPDQDFGQQNENQVSEIDPLTFASPWEGDYDGEFDPEATWDEDHDNELAHSNHSSVTLSSKASKRSFDEFENGGEDFEEHDDHWSPPSSPESKRSRIS